MVDEINPLLNAHLIIKRIKDHWAGKFKEKLALRFLTHSNIGSRKIYLKKHVREDIVDKLRDYLTILQDNEKKGVSYDRDIFSILETEIDMWESFIHRIDTITMKNLATTLPAFEHFLDTAVRRTKRNEKKLGKEVAAYQAAS